MRATTYPSFSETPARPSYLAGLALLVVALAICFAGGMAVGYQDGVLPRPQEVTLQMIQQGVPYSAYGLLALFVLQHLRGSILKGLIGEKVLGPLFNGLASLALAFAACYALMLEQGSQPEPYLATLFDGMSHEQVQQLCLRLVLFGAIAEELLVRHFFMRICGWHDGGYWKWSAIFTGMAASMVLMLQHPFVNDSSLLLMGLVYGIIGIARVNSRGMLVPIVLHAAAMGAVLVVMHPQLVQ